jgi:hypothetical protein
MLKNQKLGFHSSGFCLMNVFYMIVVPGWIIGGISWWNKN